MKLLHFYTQYLPILAKVSYSLIYETGIPPVWAGQFIDDVTQALGHNFSSSNVWDRLTVTLKKEKQWWCSGGDSSPGRLLVRAALVPVSQFTATVEAER